MYWKQRRATIQLWMPSHDDEQEGELGEGRVGCIVFTLLLTAANHCQRHQHRGKEKERERGKANLNPNQNHSPKIKRISKLETLHAVRNESCSSYAPMHKTTRNKAAAGRSRKRREWEGGLRSSSIGRGEGEMAGKGRNFSAQNLQRFAINGTSIVVKV